MQRWAWSELLSPSFGHVYAAFGAEPLIMRKSEGVQFEALSPSERLALRGLHAAVRGPLSCYWDGVAAFVRVEWQKGRLARTLAMRGNAYKPEDRIPLAEFVPFAVRAGWLNVSAPTLAFDPLVIGVDPEDGAAVLVDGFHRAAQFLAVQSGNHTIPIYAPAVSSTAATPIFP